MDAFCLKAGIHGINAPPIDVAGNVELRLSSAAAEKPSTSRNFSWGFTLHRPLRSLWPGSDIRLEPAVAVDDAVLGEKGGSEGDRANENWVYRALRFNSFRKGEEIRVKLEEKATNCVEDKEDCCVENDDVCTIDHDEIEFDRESFTKLLRKIPLVESRLYAQLSYLGSLAYCIPKIKVLIIFVFIASGFISSFRLNLVHCLLLALLFEFIVNFQTFRYCVLFGLGF